MAGWSIRADGRDPEMEGSDGKTKVKLNSTNKPNSRQADGWPTRRRLEIITLISGYGNHWKKKLRNKRFSTKIYYDLFASTVMAHVEDQHRLILIVSWVQDYDEIGLSI